MSKFPDQPTDASRSTPSRSGVEVGNWVIVPAHPEWGIVQILAVSTNGMITVIIGQGKSAWTACVGRSALQIDKQRATAPVERLEQDKAAPPPQKKDDAPLPTQHKPSAKPLIQTAAASSPQSPHVTPSMRPDINHLVKDLQMAGSAPQLTDVLTKIEYMSCTACWEDEVRLGYALSAHKDLEARRLAAIRFDFAYVLSAKTLPFSIEMESVRRPGVFDRCDIACQIGKTMLEGLSKRELADRPHAVARGMRYLKLVYDGTQLYYPDLFLYAHTLYKQENYGDAVEIALKLHRRAEKVYGKVPYDDWAWQYRMPWMTAFKSFRGLMNELTYNGYLNEAEVIYQRMRSLGFTEEVDRPPLAPFQRRKQNTLDLDVAPSRPVRSRSALIERLETILRKQGEPTHYSVLVDIYKARHENISARDLCGILNANKQVFREVESGTYALLEQTPQEQNWLLDLLAEVNDASGK